MTLTCLCQLRLSLSVTATLLTLALTLDLNWDDFHKDNHHQLKNGLEKALRRHGLSIRSLFVQIEPAVFFHELWLYQMMRRNSARKLRERERAYNSALRKLCSADSPLPRRSKTDIAADFTRAIGGELPPIDLGWTAAQRGFLERSMGLRALRGEELRGKGKTGAYAVHKAPYWGETMRVLRESLTSRPLLPPRSIRPKSCPTASCILSSPMYSRGRSSHAAAQFVRLRAAPALVAKVSVRSTWRSSREEIAALRSLISRAMQRPILRLHFLHDGE